MPRGRAIAALVVAAATFAIYYTTLLPGFDFGDTGSFQTTVGSPLLTPRDGYPLYFALGNVFLRLTRAEPARALNLASAVEAAFACGLLALLGAELSGSVLAGAATALLFAVSYTFWSQSVIAEVYALHIALVALTMLRLLRWAAAPTPARLALFFASYALAFGNHLSMILLAPAYTAFLFVSAPAGWRSMLRPRVLALAVAFACLGALQYVPIVHALWFLPQPPHGIGEGLQRFWFDVTKSDWRNTMVMNVPRSAMEDHLAMYWFDLRQQFGTVVPFVAIAGALVLAWTHWRRALLMLSAYGVSFLFAYTYNVGDTHVFYLPSHMIVALLTGCAVSAAAHVTPRGAEVSALVLAAYACARGYQDYPALDRSDDHRPPQVLTMLTAGLDDRHAILIADLNWQVQNGLSYFGKVTRPEVAYAHSADMLLHAPALVADNRAIGREVALSERAHARLAAAYGPLLPAVVDPRVAAPTLSDVVRDLPAGTRYALCILKPSRDVRIDRADVSEALRLITGRTLPLMLDSDYVAVGGVVGDAPRYLAAASMPFRRSVDIAGVPVQIRMESWLSADTIRRMGFGHVIAARQHTLIVERGVSFVAFDERGRPIRTAYAANIFAPQRRYVIAE